MNKPGANQGEGDIINILLVDDIPETRENIKKLLAFEPDFKVVGSVGTGREGVTMAKELRPNIIIMDINMPDMDGIQATTLITESVPTVAVIMMSVQNDPDYLRRAMLAGARNFLTKPILPDELYNTIRTVHIRNKPIAAQYAAMQQNQTVINTATRAAGVGDENRAGHIIVVYSPQGGAGCTTIATNLASGLMRDGVRTLIVDANLQFSDVGVFLNIQVKKDDAQRIGVVALVNNLDDLDTDLFENVVLAHETGLKVLVGPTTLEDADFAQSQPAVVARILEKVANLYDFIIVDTGRHLDDSLISLLDLAAKVIVVGTPTITSLKNTRVILDVFKKLEYPQDKTMLVMNRVPTDRNLQKLAYPVDQIEKFLSRPVDLQIPSDEMAAMTALRKGYLLVAQRDRTRSPVKELIQLSETLYTTLMGNQEKEEAPPPTNKAGQVQKKPTLGLRFGKG